MVRKFGQALAAAVIIVGVSSVAGAGAGANGRGDQSVCAGKNQEAFSCLDKYEKDGVEVYCVTANINSGKSDGGGSSVSLSCDWEHAKHPDSK
jgi:hypothetical protein